MADYSAALNTAIFLVLAGPPAAMYGWKKFKEERARRESAHQAMIELERVRAEERAAARKKRDEQYAALGVPQTSRPKPLKPVTRW